MTMQGDKKRRERQQEGPSIYVFIRRSESVKEIHIVSDIDYGRRNIAVVTKVIVVIVIGDHYFSILFFFLFSFFFFSFSSSYHISLEVK